MAVFAELYVGSEHFFLQVVGGGAVTVQSALPDSYDFLRRAECLPVVGYLPGMDSPSVPSLQKDSFPFAGRIVGVDVDIFHIMVLDRNPSRPRDGIAECVAWPAIIL